MRDVKVYESEAVSQTETWSSENLDLSWIFPPFMWEKQQDGANHTLFCQITKDLSVEMWFKME